MTTEATPTSPATVVADARDQNASACTCRSSASADSSTWSANRPTAAAYPSRVGRCLPVDGAVRSLNGLQWPFLDRRVRDGFLQIQPARGEIQVVHDLLELEALAGRSRQEHVLKVRFANLGRGPRPLLVGVRQDDFANHGLG